MNFRVLFTIYETLNIFQKEESFWIPALVFSILKRISSKTRDFTKRERERETTFDGREARSAFPSFLRPSI